MIDSCLERVYKLKFLDFCTYNSFMIGQKCRKMELPLRPYSTLYNFLNLSASILRTSVNLLFSQKLCENHLLYVQSVISIPQWRKISHCDCAACSDFARKLVLRLIKLRSIYFQMIVLHLSVVPCSTISTLFLHMTSLTQRPSCFSQHFRKNTSEQKDQILQIFKGATD